MPEHIQLPHGEVDDHNGQSEFRTHRIAVPRTSDCLSTAFVIVVDVVDFRGGVL
jgi:hypothetical protein